MLQAASSGDACGGRSDGLVVRLRLDLAEGVASTLDFGDDVVGGGLPFEGLGIAVPILGPVVIAAVRSATLLKAPRRRRLWVSSLKPAFDEVQPGTRGRREVHVPAATVLVRQPFRDRRRAVR